MPHGQDDFREATEVYGAYLRERGDGRATSLEKLYAEHPALRTRLEQIHGCVELSQSLASSRQFQQSIRASLGDVDEVTVAPESSPGALDGVSGVEPLARSPGRRYENEGEIDRGGMGVIFKVRDRDLSRSIAMKVMRRAADDGDASEAELGRFLEEAQVTAQLEHPGIVPVHELGLDANGRAYFTMRLVKGRTLGEILELARAEQEGWNLSRAIGALIKVCQALAFAHAKGVVHRDLKPSNIMVGRFGEVYVMDWGLAKATGKQDHHDLRISSEASFTMVRSDRREVDSSPDSPLVTMDGTVVGTPAYMPPEQAQGRIDQIDHTSDVYSLGAILYKVLAGHPPYVRPGANVSPRTILAMVIQGPPAPSRELAPESPPELVAICEKAMAREKNARYASSLDMAEDLQAYLDRRVVRAYRTGAVAELKSWVIRNRAAALFSVLVTLLVVGFACVYAVVEHRNALELQSHLATQYLHRGRALCERGKVTNGLHWMVRALEVAPPRSAELKTVIRENLAGWRREINPPVAVFTHVASAPCAALSPDGKFVATASQDRRVWLWKTSNGEVAGLPIEFTSSVDRLRFTPDNRRLLIQTPTDVRVWSVESRELVMPPLPASFAHLSPDGRHVLGVESGELKLWSLDTGELVIESLDPATTPVTAAFSIDGEQVAIADGDQNVHLWSVQSGRSRTIVPTDETSIGRLVFGPDAKRIAITQGSSAQIWDTDVAQPVGLPIRHDGEVRDLVFSSDGNLVLTGSEDGTGRLWDTATGQPKLEPFRHEGSVDVVAFSPDAVRAVTASRDKTVRIWSTETGETLGAPLEHDGRVVTLSFSTDGKQILTTAHDHTVKLWSVEASQAVVQTFRGAHEVTSAEFSTDGKQVVTSSMASVRLWSASTGEELCQLQPRHNGWVATFTPDGTRVVGGSRDGRVRFWSVETGELLETREAHRGSIRCLSFSRDGTMLATGGFDGKARVWSAASGEPLSPPLEHDGFVEDLAFSLDGRNVLTACGDGRARLWQIGTGELVFPPLRHRRAVLAATFSRDGQLIATGSRDHTVRFWNTETGEPAANLLVHESGVEDVTFSPDGRHVATSTSSGKAWLWSVSAGEIVGPPFHHGDGIFSVTFDPSAPNGSRLLTASDDFSARIWQLPTVLPLEEQADLWVEAMTGTTMDKNGVVLWLDPAAMGERREKLRAVR